MGPVPLDQYWVYRYTRGAWQMHVEPTRPFSFQQLRVDSMAGKK